ncbi:MAG: hypothetical protein GF311_01630 [Candidatus Lokiarchaeota archaeon]|nr:hypothetical protein [Candidatus Lokiarchaeota archaeon]
MEDIDCFFNNLKYQIKLKNGLLDKPQMSFYEEVKRCIESFESVYYRDAYKELINEFSNMIKETD